MVLGSFVEPDAEPSLRHCDPRAVHLACAFGTLALYLPRNACGALGGCRSPSPRTCLLSLIITLTVHIAQAAAAAEPAAEPIKTALYDLHVELGGRVRLSFCRRLSAYRRASFSLGTFGVSSVCSEYHFVPARRRCGFTRVAGLVYLLMFYRAFFAKQQARLLACAPLRPHHH